MIEVHDRLRPKSFAKFLANHQLSRLFQQHGQQLERLFLQPDPFAKPREFAGSKVSFENPELKTPERLYGLLHDKPERSEDSSACRITGWSYKPDRLKGIPASKPFNSLYFSRYSHFRKIAPMIRRRNIHFQSHNPRVCNVAPHGNLPMPCLAVRRNCIAAIPPA